MEDFFVLISPTPTTRHHHPSSSSHDGCKSSTRFPPGGVGEPPAAWLFTVTRGRYCVERRNLFTTKQQRRTKSEEKKLFSITFTISQTFLQLFSTHQHKRAQYLVVVDADYRSFVTSQHITTTTTDDEEESNHRGKRSTGEKGNFSASFFIT